MVDNNNITYFNSFGVECIKEIKAFINNNNSNNIIRIIITIIIMIKTLKKIVLEYKHMIQ